MIKAALIDLYNGEENLGIDSIKSIVQSWGDREVDGQIALDQFETRKLGTAPGPDYDLYISSGGPGSPFDGEGQAWEARYFEWLDSIWHYNQRPEVQKGTLAPKHVLFICHSFQMMCRHFELGEVTPRKSTSFGIFKTHQTATGQRDPLFEGLDNPFYVADFRDWQVIRPNLENLQSIGASILAYEKERPHIPLERAIMGIRISPEMVGVQFHPEADPAGMLYHFQKEHRRDHIIKEHGEAKYNQIIERLKKPDYLLRTYEHIIPNFLAGTRTFQHTK